MARPPISAWNIHTALTGQHIAWNGRWRYCPERVASVDVGSLNAKSLLLVLWQCSRQGVRTFFHRKEGHASCWQPPHTYVPCSTYVPACVRFMCSQKAAISGFAAREREGVG